MPLALPRLGRRRATAGVLVLVVVAALVGWAVWPRTPGWTARNLRITVLSGPGGTGTVDLDARFYLPRDRSGAVPAVLLAHGFGGTKMSVGGDAEALADRGYAGLTRAPRGVGGSGGESPLRKPGHRGEGAARRLGPAGPPP